MFNRAVQSWAPFSGSTGADSQAMTPAPGPKTAQQGRISSGLVVPGMPVTGSFCGPVAECAALAWRSHYRINITSADFLPFQNVKGVSAKHGEIVRMAVVALTGVVLGKGRAATDAEFPGSLLATGWQLIHLGEVRTE